jgi:hypothetical protein
MEKKMVWHYNAMDGKWYLFGEDEDEPIAEVGVEDAELEGEKSYYWIDLECSSGYGDYDTVDEAKSVAEGYFKGYLV